MVFGIKMLTADSSGSIGEAFRDQTCLSSTSHRYLVGPKSTPQALCHVPQTVPEHCLLQVHYLAEKGL